MNQELKIGAMAVLGVTALAGLVGKRIFRRKNDLARKEERLGIYHEELNAWHKSLDELYNTIDKAVVDAKFWLLVTEEG